MSYSEKLRDPRWQRKRLEILNGSDFTCRDCGAKDKTLHVHHAYYDKGVEPWEYPDTALVSLCEDCHETRQGLQNYILLILGMINEATILRILGYGIGVWVGGFPYARSDEMAAMPIPSGRSATQGFRDATGVQIQIEREWPRLDAVINEFDYASAQAEKHAWPTADSVCP